MKKDRCEIGYEKLINNFASSLQGGKILDCGCGNGNYTPLFSHDNNEVVGVDIVDLRFKKYVGKFVFSIYDGKKLPYKSNSFDYVVGFDVVEHIADDASYIEEAKRVLKRWGMLYLATPKRTRLSNTILKIIGKKVRYTLVLSKNGRLGPVVHIREYVQELKNLLRKQNFHEIKIRPFWLGLRGSINVGFCYPILPPLSQYLFVTARKN